MARNETQNTFKVVVEEVRSGDDLVLLVDLGIDDLYKRVRARLKGVDTPDAYRSPIDSPARQIREEVRHLTRGECKVVISHKNPKGWIVDLYVLQADQTKEAFHVNQFLIDRGYAFVGLDNSERAVA